MRSSHCKKFQITGTWHRWGIFPKTVRSYGISVSPRPSFGQKVSHQLRLHTRPSRFILPFLFFGCRIFTWPAFRAGNITCGLQSLFVVLAADQIMHLFPCQSIPSIDKGKYAFRQQIISSTKDSVRTILWAEIQRVFREQMGRSAKADEAAGLTPGNEDNAGSRFICREKPCLLLSIDGNVRRFPDSFLLALSIGTPLRLESPPLYIVCKWRHLLL